MKNPLVIHASCPRKLLFVSARSNYSRARKREENRGLRNQKIDDTEKRCAIRGDKIIVASKIRLTHAAPPTGLLIGHRFLVKQNIYRRAWTPFLGNFAGRWSLNEGISRMDGGWWNSGDGWKRGGSILFGTGRRNFRGGIFTRWVFARRRRYYTGSLKFVLRSKKFVFGRIIYFLRLWMNIYI